MSGRACVSCWLGLPAGPARMPHASCRARSGKRLAQACRPLPGLAAPVRHGHPRSASTRRATARSLAVTQHADPAGAPGINLVQPRRMARRLPAPARTRSGRDTVEENNSVNGHDALWDLRGCRRGRHGGLEMSARLLHPIHIRLDGWRLQAHDRCGPLQDHTLAVRPPERGLDRAGLGPHLVPSRRPGGRTGIVRRT